ncbi:MAG: IS110 family transposase [Flammeovirgaceae bacterium]
MQKSIVGIDISKKDFTVSLLREQKHHVRSFDNDRDGYEKLLAWLKESDAKVDIFCMEATGSYGDALADFLYAHDHHVSVVNPFQIKSFAQTLLKRHKTDKVDCKVIAYYAGRFEPDPYVPLDPNIKELRQLYRCALALNKHLTGFRNRLEHQDRLCQEVTVCWDDMIALAEQKLRAIELRMTELVQASQSVQQDFEHLQTIPGIAKKTALALLAELPDIAMFDNARQLAAFAGLTPRHCTSGTSLHRKARISKVGSSTLRKALFLPAITAKNHNPVMKAFAKKLADKGKPAKVIIAAIMRKLLHLVFAIIKNKIPFNPHFHLAN